MRYIRRIFIWLTATRRRKILSLSLAVLVFVTSIRYLFLPAKEVQAADVYLAMDEGYGTSGAVRDSNSTVSAGSITNAVWRAEEFCKTGKCLYFDGDGDFVSFADDTNLDFTATNTFTIQGWFRTGDITSGTRVLVAKHNATAGGYKVYMDSSGYLIFGIDDDLTWGPVDTASTSTTAFDDNKWHFFSAVKNGTASISLYVDGILYQTDSSLTETGSLVNANTFYLGIDGDGTANDYLGFLDEVKILRTARSQSEVITDYLGGNTSLTGAGPIGWWKMDESSANTCTGGVNDSCDNSGNANDGAWNGNATNATGKFGNAISLDGTGDYVQVTGLMGNPTSITLAGWVNLTSPDTNGAELVTLGDIVSIRLDISSQLQAFFYDGTDWRVTTINDTLAAEGWHHLAYTVDTVSKVQKLYLDGGVAVGSSSFTGSINYSGQGTNTLIGRHGNGSTNYDFNGLIDDVRIYDYARSQNQVLEDMAGYPPSGTSASFGPDTSYLSSGLVGYWKMDDNDIDSHSCPTGGTGDTCDASGNNNHGSDSGAMTDSDYVAAKYGYGLDFDGTDDYMNMGSATNLDNLPSTAMTVSMWVKPTNSNNFFVSKDDGGTNGWIIGMVGSDDIQLVVPSSTTNATTQTNSNILSSSTWNHVSITYNNNTDRKVRIFINGAESTYGTQTAAEGNVSSDSSYNFQVGWRGFGDYWQGAIDDLRVYNRALTPAEVAKLYAFAPGPVGHWKMDENTGTTSTFDSSTTGNTGTLDGSMTASDWVSGKFGSALDFDGSDDRVTVTNNSTLQPTTFSASAWIYRTATADPINGSGVAGNWIGDSPVDSGFILWLDNSNVAMLPIGTAPHLSSGYTVPINTWTHMAGTFDGTTARIYINGTLMNSATDTLVYANTPFEIGRYANQNSTNFPGKIDDVKLYNYVRTPTQILEDMNGGHPAPGSPIGSAVAYWNFDEGYGTTAYDSNASTGGAEDLTLSAASWTNSGKFGKAWDGTGARWLSRADDSDLDFAASESFTISGWFKHSAASAVEAIFQKLESTGTDGGYRIQMEADGDITCETDDDDADTTVDDTATTTAATYDDGAWHHVACVYDTTNTDLLIYIDGVLTASDTSTTSNSLANDDALYVGDSNGVDGSDEFNGDLDEFRVYRSALSADQVKVEYNNSSAQTLGVLSTDSTGAASNSNLDAYCPPGQGSACTAPVGHWKLDENTGTASTFDSSTNGNAVTLTSSPPWVTGKLGSALDFDGSADYMSTSSTINIGTKIATVSFWLNWDTFANDDDIAMELSSSFNNNDGAFLILPNCSTCAGRFAIGIQDSVGTFKYRQESFTRPSHGVWHYYSFILDNSTTTGDVKAYVDGIEQATTIDVNNKDQSSNFAIDTLYFMARGGSSLFGAGQLDDIRIYNYERTPAQIAWDYNRGAPVGHWQMDESSWNGTAGEVKDASLNANHGVRAGNATTTTGKINNGGTFDNLGDYVSITNATPLEITGDLTISAWVKRNSSAAQDTIVDMALDGETEATNHLYHLYFDSSGFLNLIWEYGAGSNQTTQSSVAVSTPTGSWSHIAVTRNVTTNEVKYYENGIQLGTTQSFTNDPTGGTTANLILGAAGSTLADWPFDGLIDDVRLYNYVATPQQIKIIMNDNSAIKFWQ